MDVNNFFRGFTSELTKIGSQAHSIEQIAKGKPVRITLPINREPTKGYPRSADVAV